MRLTKDQRLDKIREAAIQIFAKDNFKGATTKEIAELAGCTEALLFKYFKNKDEIINDIFAHNVFQQNDSRFNELFKNSLNFKHLLEILFKFYISCYVESPDLFKFILRHEYTNSDFANYIYQTRIEKRLTVFATDFALRKKRGEIKQHVDCHMLASIVLELCNSISTKILFLHLNEKSVTAHYQKIAKTLALEFCEKRSN